MNTYEIDLKVYLLKDISKESALEKIANLIDLSFLKNEDMKDYHKSIKFKNYVFNSFYPLEKSIYKSKNIYTIKLRVFGNDFNKFFKEALPGLRSDDIQILTAKSTLIDKKHILEIYSITPAVCKFDNGYWKEHETFEIFEKRIKENAIKKYNFFFNTKLDENFDFIKKIDFKNRIPIGTKYKNVTLLGDKLQIELEDNEFAQKLGWIIFSTGLLELGARGFGYVNAKFI